MSTHNIQFHDKIRKKSLNICFLELLEEFCREKRVRIIHGKRGICVRAIEVILYINIAFNFEMHSLLNYSPFDILWKDIFCLAFYSK